MVEQLDNEYKALCAELGQNIFQKDALDVQVKRLADRQVELKKRIAEVIKEHADAKKALANAAAQMDAEVVDVESTSCEGERY